MNELMFLNEEDFMNIVGSLRLANNVAVDASGRELGDRLLKTLAKVGVAYEEGLLLSFDVKKVKARRVR